MPEQNHDHPKYCQRDSQEKNSDKNQGRYNIDNTGHIETVSLGAAGDGCEIGVNQERDE